MTNSNKYISTSILPSKAIVGFLFLFYLSNLLFAKIPSTLLKQYIDSEIANTVAVDKNIDSFDFNMITDFIRNNGSGAGVILSLIPLGIIIYFLWHTFLSAAWIRKLLNHDYQYLWLSSIEHINYWKLIRLNAYAFLFYIFILGLLNFGFYSGGLNPFDLNSDRELINRFLLWNGIAFIIVYIFRAIHQLAKYYVVDSKSKFLFSPMKSTVKGFLNKFIQIMGIQIIYSFLTLLIVFLTVKLSINFNYSSFFKATIFFLISQFLILALIYLKLIKYKLFSEIYEKLNDR